MIKLALLVSALVMATTAPVDGGGSLHMAVSPAYAMAPANLKVRIRLEPSADNRTLEVVADGDRFFRSSEIELQGDRAPAAIEFGFRNVPGGSYEVFAVLKGQGGRQRAKALQSVTIFSDEEQVE